MSKIRPGLKSAFFGTPNSLEWPSSVFYIFHSLFFHSSWKLRHGVNTKKSLPYHLIPCNKLFLWSFWGGKGYFMPGLILFYACNNKKINKYFYLFHGIKLKTLKNSFLCKRFVWIFNKSNNSIFFSSFYAQQESNNKIISIELRY